MAYYKVNRDSRKCVDCGEDFESGFLQKKRCDKCKAELNRMRQRSVNTCSCGAEIGFRKQKCDKCKAKDKPDKLCVDCGTVLSNRYRKRCYDCSENHIAEYKKSYVQIVTDKLREYFKNKSKANKNRRKGLAHDLAASEWRDAVGYFGACAYCGEVCSEYHREHFIPAALGGGYTKANIIPACEKCNLSKSSTHPLVWLKRQGMEDRYDKILSYFETL